MSLSKKSKVFLLFLVISLFIGFGVYNYVMKPPATIESKKVNFTGTSDAFIKMVQENSKDWIDKVVVLEGIVTSGDGGKGVVLNNQIYCQFKETRKIGVFQQKIKIKGRFIGYDDLLEELKLDQCIIQE